jgi:peptidoglycan/LPS O-acetylase OafA/YrhL
VEEVNDVVTKELCAPQELRAPEWRHVAALDGLRGIAVIMVLFYHSAFISFEGKGIFISLIGHACRAGWVGVDLFFALSGFLITGILINTIDDPAYFRKFYLRRSLRIFPLYYGLFFLLLLLTPVLAIRWNGSLPYFLLYVQNYATYARLEISTRFGMIHLEHLWSLAIEEQFYLVWPFMVWLFRGRPSFLVIPLFILIACPIARIMALHYGLPAHVTYLWTPFRVDSLAWGAMAAMVQRYAKAGLRARLPLIAVLSGLSVILLIAIYRHGVLDQYDPLMIKAGYSAVGFTSFGTLLILLKAGSFPATLVSLSPLRWMGKFSYGIYVYHYIFNGYFGTLRAYTVNVTHFKVLGTLALVIQTFAVGIGLAWLSYNLYEKHWLRLKDVVARYGM